MTLNERSAWNNCPERQAKCCSAGSMRRCPKTVRVGKRGAAREERRKENTEGSGIGRGQIYFEKFAARLGSEGVEELFFGGGGAGVGLVGWDEEDEAIRADGLGDGCGSICWFESAQWQPVRVVENGGGNNSAGAIADQHDAIAALGANLADECAVVQRGHHGSGGDGAEEQNASEDWNGYRKSGEAIGQQQSKDGSGDAEVIVSRHLDNGLVSDYGQQQKGADERDVGEGQREL